MSKSSTSSSSSSITQISADAESPSNYIFMVQHLIEKCLVLKMDQAQCVEALSKNANVDPIITITVWNELVKENSEFFSSYLSDTTRSRSSTLYDQKNIQQTMKQSQRS